MSDPCPDCDEMTRQRDHYRSENAKLRAALSEIKRLTKQSRMWGGLSWHFNPMRPETVKRVAELAESMGEGN